MTEITADNYLVEDKEKGYFHCKMEIKAFNPTTGERLSRPYIQKFDAKGFEDMLYRLKKLGYTVDILHDPTKPVKVETPAEKAVETETASADIEKAKAMAKKLKA